MKADANQKHTKHDNIAFILFILLLSYLVNVTAQKQWRNFVWVDNFILFLGAGYLPVQVICWNFFLVIVKIDWCGWSATWVNGRKLG